MPADDVEPRAARISLRTRLTVWVIAVFTLIQLVIGGAFWFHQRDVSRTLFERQLLERAQYMAAEVRSRLPLLTRQELAVVAQAELGYVQFDRSGADLVDATGKTVLPGATRWPALSSRLAPLAIESGRPQRAALDEKEADDRLSDRETSQAVALRIRSDDGANYALIVVTSDAYLVEQHALITRVLVIGGLIGLLASAFSGWLIAGIAVEPIRRLSDVAGQLRPETIDKKLVIESRNAEIAELTRELDAARARIRAAFAAQERFLSNISHELKTPIATLLLESQTLDRSGFPESAVEFVETTEDEMRKLGKLIESFLMLTRVRDGSGLARLRSYPPNELVMDAVVDCAAMADLYTVRLEPTLADQNDPDESCVIGDPDLLRTMLNNLIRNAIRFTPRSGRVLVVASSTGSRFTIAVRDGGPGIAPEIIDTIFDRHVRGQEEPKRGHGHGLGLAIAKGIAELHGGDIAARNLPGGGAEFTVDLPIRSRASVTGEGASNGRAARDGSAPEGDGSAS
ncbi:MAG: sensor histidine kinase [Phycisphaerales bacterium]